MTPWQHEHTFGQDRTRAGERRTWMVIVITAAMMVVEIVAGIVYGSMALLADGLHMASHAAALGITAYAYFYARRHAQDSRFSFGTGKVNALAGFASATLLAVFALLMASESIRRFISPVEIIFNQAIVVAVLGLVVNAVSVFILGVKDEHGHKHSDHNLRAAYLHVLADALTSLLAIFALLAGKYFGLDWMDPLMGVVGAALVARWSWGLLKETGRILLDRQATDEIQARIREAIESQDGARVVDLHVWSIGPGINALSIAVATDQPMTPEHFKQLLPPDLGLVHTTVEVHVTRM